MVAHVCLKSYSPNCCCFFFFRCCQINEGTIGDVRTIHITSRDPAPPPVAYLQNSGGIFMDMTSHDFDMARFLVRRRIFVFLIVAKGAQRITPRVPGHLSPATNSVLF